MEEKQGGGVQERMKERTVQGGNGGVFRLLWSLCGFGRVGRGGGCEKGAGVERWILKTGIMLGMLGMISFLQMVAK